METGTPTGNEKKWINCKENPLQQQVTNTLKKQGERSEQTRKTPREGNKKGNHGKKPLKPRLPRLGPEGGPRREGTEIRPSHKGGNREEWSQKTQARARVEACGGHTKGKRHRRRNQQGRAKAQGKETNRRTNPQETQHKTEE